MLFALLFISFMAIICIIMTGIILVVVLNFRMIELAEADHWLNKLILFRQERFKEIAEFQVFTSSNILGLDPIEETTGSMVSRWLTSYRTKVEIAGEVINRAKDFIPRTSTSKASTLPAGSI